ncbi:MAG: his Kinase domain protein [Bacilli bacterium]|nr:his Kinase domain protein [Bacilli bacterium]
MAERHSHSKWQITKGILGILGFTVFIMLCWSAAFYISPVFFHWIGRHPNGFIMQIMNSLLGFFIFGCFIAIIGKLTAPKRMEVIKAIIDGIKRIAKGDFNVTLPLDDNNRNNPFGEIVVSINNMAVELNQMEQMRQEFISNVSHEIQSPLTSISGFARVLQNDHMSQEERLHYLGIIESESMRLAKLSENLLKLTSLESEHHPFEPKRYRLDKQLRNIVLSCEPQWLEKKLEMDISLDEVNVHADEDLLSQVWVNLVHNSIKFSTEPGVIGIQMYKKEQEVIVCISDTGIGITEEDQEHIFERFYKADKSRNRSTIGSGLGLAIVKKIIEMHKGTIQVESGPDMGTQMTVRLPIGS